MNRLNQTEPTILANLLFWAFFMITPLRPCYVGDIWCLVISPSSIFLELHLIIQTLDGVSSSFFWYFMTLVCKNLSPVTREDGIFPSRGGLFTQKQSPESQKFHPYRLLVTVSFSCISFLKIKMVQMGLMFAFMNALIFIVAYEFTHSLINVPMTSFQCNIHS